MDASLFITVSPTSSFDPQTLSVWTPEQVLQPACTMAARQAESDQTREIATMYHLLSEPH